MRWQRFSQILCSVWANKSLRESRIYVGGRESSLIWFIYLKMHKYTSNFMKQKRKRCKTHLTSLKAMAKWIQHYSKIRCGQQRHNKYIQFSQPLSLCVCVYVHTHFLSYIRDKSFIHFGGHNGFFLLLKISEQEIIKKKIVKLLILLTLIFKVPIKASFQPERGSLLASKHPEIGN